MKPKNCLIFGASGQIGRNLIRGLTQKNLKVTAVTRNLHQKGYILKTQANPGYLDIVETNIVNLEEYSVDKSSYCKERAESKKLIWSQNFDENYLSPNVWNYSTSNGFYDGKQFISGWGNGELQYYTMPRK